MELELVEEEDVKKYKKARKKTRFKKYDVAVEKHVEWIKEKIKDSKDGRIIIRTKQFAKSLGSEFTGYSNQTIFLSVKLALWKRDIFVGTGKHKKDNEDLLILRVKDESDTLPSKLKRELEEEEKLEEEEEKSEEEDETGTESDN